MIRIRKAGDRGYAERDWLKSFHSFSFADYHDPEHMAFGPLRVINEDWIAPDKGFPMHPHRDMEIITYLLEGALEHKDSMGNGSVIRPGEVQRMSAGTGVFHSEFNPSPTDTAHLLQIWIIPDRGNHRPGYEQKAFADEDKRGRLCLVASPDGRDGSVTIHQDAFVYASLLDGGESAQLKLAPGRLAWVQVAAGKVHVNGQACGPGDAVGASEVGSLDLHDAEGAELLVFDLPA